MGSPYENLLPHLAEVKDSPFAGIGLIAALGFAFCYVASAPILTIHATRVHLRPTTGRSTRRKLGALLACILGLFGVFTYFLPVAVSSVLGVILGIQLFLLLCATTNNFKQVADFYFAIAETRSHAATGQDRSPGNLAEYVTSYRHLREHGNAFCILLLEAALAYVLYSLPGVASALIILVVWVLPASSVWAVGTTLEMRLADKRLAG